MAQTFSQRAPFNDWWYWSECLVKRFRTAAEIYRENGEKERADSLGDLATQIKETCMVPVMEARKGLTTDEQKENVKKLEEEAIFKAANFFRDVLANFPFISSSLQEFLYVDWQDCKWPDENDADELDEETGLPKKKKKRTDGDSRVTELFWGPKERQDEGIRSGKPEDGGLPGILFNMVAAEKTSSNRSPTDYGQAMQAAANQQFIAMTKETNQKWEKAGVKMNFKPGSGI